MAPIRLPCLVGGDCNFQTVQLEYEQADATGGDGVIFDWSEDREVLFRSGNFLTPVGVRQGVSDQRAAPVGGAPGDGVDVIAHGIGARWGGVRM